MDKEFIYKDLLNLNPSQKINIIEKILNEGDSLSINELLNFLYERDFSFVKKIKFRNGNVLGVITSGAGRTGQARVLCDLANKLSRVGYKVIFIIGEEFKYNDYKLDRQIIKRVLSSNNRYKDLNKIIKENKINAIIHNNIWRETNCDLVLCKLLEIKNLFCLHVSFPSFYFLKNKEHFFDFIKNLSLCECLIVTNQFDYNLFKNFAKKTYLIKHSIDYIKNDYHNAPVHDKKNKILWIARGYDSRKRADDIILIAKELVKQNVDFEINVVGPFPFSFQDLILKNKLGKYIKLLGFHKTISKYLTDATLLISTSNTESFGMSLVEAMYFKKPIVMYRIPYLPFSDSKGIFSTDIGDYKEFANYIYKLLKNKKLCITMGNINKEFIDKLYKNYDIGKTWKEILEYENQFGSGQMDYFFETYPGTKIFEDEVKPKLYLTFKQEVKTVLLFVPHTIKRVIRRISNILKRCFKRK